MQDCERIENCLLCGTLLDVYPKSFHLDLGFTPLANEFSEYKDYIEDDLFPLNIIQCHSCKHLQLDTIVNPNRLFRDYLYVSSTSPVNRKHFQDYAISLIEDFDLKKGQQIVEIGSNDGLLLSFLKEKGLYVLGIDPARNIAREASVKGIPTIPEFFTASLAKNLLQGIRVDGSSWICDPAKIVIANHMFAHTKDLNEIVKSILEILADDGIFVFENSYLLDILDKCLLGIFYHEHCHTHSISPLIKFFRKFGMKIFRVQRLPNQQGGSIRVFVCKNSAKYKVDQSVFDILELEKEIPFKLTQFRTKIEKWKSATNSVLFKLKNDKKVIDIYGYPAKLTTELYTLNLEKGTFRYAYDDAELKVGKYSPGLHIPVLHPNEIMKHNPDVLFIGGWNFANSIIEKCKQMGYKGKFIVPLPELKVIE